MGTHTRLLKTMVLLALCLMLLLAGCAGATRVSSTEKIAAAERAIRDATQSEAALTAAPDLETARAKLGPARAAAAVLLQKNPKVAVLFEGHTDSAGTDTLNAVLSAKRAESVKQVLVARGVSAIGS